MRKKCVQMSLYDIYNDVTEAVENKKPKLIMLLEEADVFLVEIVQLVAVLLADSMHKQELLKSIRKLIA